MPVLYVYEAPEASLQLYDKINACRRAGVGKSGS